MKWITDKSSPGWSTEVHNATWYSIILWGETYRARYWDYSFKEIATSLTLVGAKKACEEHARELAIKRSLEGIDKALTKMVPTGQPAKRKRKVPAPPCVRILHVKVTEETLKAIKEQLEARGNEHCNPYDALFVLRHELEAAFRYQQTTRGDALREAAERVEEAVAKAEKEGIEAIVLTSMALQIDAL